MREMIKMVIVLTILACFSGGVLAYLRNGTQERIENQVLAFVKGPAIRKIFEGAENNPITTILQGRIWVVPPIDIAAE